MKRRWSKGQLCKHIGLNVKDYSAAVVVSALYKKLYGEFPKGIGLSGAQAEFADSIIPKLPKRIINDPDEC
jgi:hypothetical protein